MLSVNYRLGIGYGHDFQHPAKARRAGRVGIPRRAGRRAVSALAAERRCVARRDLTAARTADFSPRWRSARNSDLFAAGVDIHGVHNWTDERAAPLLAPRYEKAPDVQRALDVAWKSSPVSAVKGWRSPVLLIHGDDDRNVRFSQTVDLVQRLTKQRVEFEELIIPGRHAPLFASRQLGHGRLRNGGVLRTQVWAEWCEGRGGKAVI